MISTSKASQLAFNNSEAIKLSKEVGCYYCCEIFNKEEIKEYTDDGKTALCPKCSVDAILCSSQGEITKQILEESNKFWFGDE